RLDARGAEAEAREEHHPIDSVAIGVAEHALGAVRVDTRNLAQAVLGGATGTWPGRFGVAPPFSEQLRKARPLSERECVGPPLETLLYQLRLDNVRIGINEFDRHFRHSFCHLLSCTVTLLPCLRISQTGEDTGEANLIEPQATNTNRQRS